MEFRLQLLHASDFEAGLEALDDAPRFSAVVNALKDDYANTLILSSGDNYIPSPFLFAGSDPTLADTPVGVPGIGRADIEILNQIGIQASALGNHEYDLGTREVRDIISRATATINGVPKIYRGALFPYLSANLNHATDPNLSGQVTANGQEASTLPAGRIAETTVITVNGERFGIVGATTPTLPRISSSGGVTVLPPNPEDYDALAAEIQTSVDQLTGAGINKIILLAHMQQFNIERDELAPRLRDVDIIVGGGSNTLLSDSTDRLRAGDTSQGAYPILKVNNFGQNVAVVNTDGNYQYVGRLVLDFDASGNIIPSSIDPNISGAYATDDAGVEAVGGTPDPEVVQITNALRTVINTQDGNTFGRTDVFLRGDRNFVRTEETNLGNLTADANLAYAKQFDPTVTVSIKNGGGIRSNIGVIEASPGSTNPDDFDLLPPAANPSAGKEEGEVSQLDISNSLRFNNGLTLLTVTAQELEQIIEHSVAATAPGATPGQFPQIGGLAFSFDATRQSIQFNGTTGAVTRDGQRVQSLAITNEVGQVIDVIAENGQIVGDPNREIRLVTLNFLANASSTAPALGGDNYPFPAFGANRVDLLQSTTAPRTGVATFAADGSEQDALAEYLTANFSTTPFSAPDVAPAQDTRIQNLAFRSDAVIVRNLINGTPGRDTLIGTAAVDRITGGFGGDLITGGAGADEFVYLSSRDAGDRITDFTVGQDRIVLTQLLDSLVVGGYSGNAIADGYIRVVAQGSNAIVQLDQDGIGTAASFRSFITLENVAASTVTASSFVF
jgi:2',3'-cyclic-nucleotide 2'-phosphodiesterase (5'-nucleotidase family)